MVGGRAWEVVLTWGRVPNWGGGVGRQPRAHAQAHAHAFDAFVPPLFFFLQRFFGERATQSQSRVLPYTVGRLRRTLRLKCGRSPPSSVHWTLFLLYRIDGSPPRTRKIKRSTGGAAISLGSRAKRRRRLVRYVSRPTLPNTALRAT